MDIALYFSLAIQVETSEVGVTFKAEPQTARSCPVCVGNTHTLLHSQVERVSRSRGFRRKSTEPENQASTLRPGPAVESSLTSLLFLVHAYTLF